MDILGVIDLPVWLVILALLFALFYFYSTSSYGVFPKMGVPGPRPWLGLGNLVGYMRKGLVETELGWLKKYGRVFGIHEGKFPVLMVGDVDMLKDITVKNFSAFTNRRDYGLRENSIPPQSHFMTILADDEWRHNRNTQTPTFSGGKLKKMSGLITKACDSLVKALEEKASCSEPIDVRKYTAAYSLQVIASTGFGLDLDIQNNPDDPFVKYARKFFEFSLFTPSFLFVHLFPFVVRILGFFRVQMMPVDSLQFYSNIIRQGLADRRENPGRSQDFLELMANAEKEAELDQNQDSTAEAKTEENSDKASTHWTDKRKGKGLTDPEILAACLIMFAAGHETTAATLNYAIYHLALNPDIQDKLIAEIDEYYDNGKTPSYENVSELPYLDMVLSEVLRINPPAGRMDRVSSCDVEIRGIRIPAGMTVALPIYMIHHDPGYWPDPETFDPERFSAENRKKHHPLQWIPFGYGPRNCIGMRLATFVVRMGLIRLLQNYRFVPNNKTLPLEFGATFLLTSTKNEICVTLEKRK